ncbi:GGDEF domain-containing protein [Rhizobium sp. WYJ-E13]|uniref:GGDEF domain-containing protein n=1 Tax=Rhizobium sp. WYJ-E13 TaxID=2849093 RepID=UPI0020A6FCB2|nr:GGDEF domain-containing protein [Rhizobium sp. WYJ-E13]
MDLATVLLLHKSSFIVGAICFSYVRWRSREPGLDLLSIGCCLLAFASTLAGMGEQGSIAFELWTLGSFSVGVTGYSLMATGLLQLSCRQRKWSDWIQVAVALILSAAVGGMHWYAYGPTRAAIFNAAAAAFLAASAARILKDFFADRLPARLGLLASLSAATGFSGLVVVGMIFPAHAPIDPRYAFFLLIICHFSLALFVIVLVQERAEAQLRHLANTDALTGIPNRQRFFASLPGAPREGDAFIMIDIDHFKSVNDRYGHETGDIVLVGVAQAIAAVAGKGMSLGRLGGEEFALFLRNETEETAFAKADEVRRAVKALVFSAGTAAISPSVSVGVALLRGAGDLQKLRDRADQALYVAKRGGRDRVEFYANPQAVTERPARADLSADGARDVDSWRKDVQQERSRVA